MLLYKQREKLKTVVQRSIRGNTLCLKKQDCYDYITLPIHNIDWLFLVDRNFIWLSIDTESVTYLVCMHTQGPGGQLYCLLRLSSSSRAFGHIGQ